jgi:hypothetical protein
MYNLPYLLCFVICDQISLTRHEIASQVWAQWQHSTTEIHIENVYEV